MASDADRLIRLDRCGEDVVPLCGDPGVDEHGELRNGQTIGQLGCELVDGQRPDVGPRPPADRLGDPGASPVVGPQEYSRSR